MFYIYSKINYLMLKIFYSKKVRFNLSIKENIQY